MRPIPSLVSVATPRQGEPGDLLEGREYDPPRGEDLFAYRGRNIRNEAELIQLRGEPEARNTFENPGP